MSYDLLIYAPQRLTTDDLTAAINSVASLSVSPEAQPHGMVRVVRGKSQRYSFTVEGPEDVEPEDLPPEVTAAVLGCTTQYSVMVEGSAASEIPFAQRFARRLADQAGGVAMDAQTDEWWTRGARREAPRPERQSLINVVEFHWYVKSSDDNAELTDRYLAACRQFLPEALPRRFGTYEPLQHKLADDGDTALRSARASDLIFFNSTFPCFGGMFDDATHRHDAVKVHNLSMDAATLTDPNWRAAARDFFQHFAIGSQAFFASAEVVQGVLWNGRSTGYDSNSGISLHLAQRGDWSGLPPYPVWWTWYPVRIASSSDRISTRQ